MNITKTDSIINVDNASPLVVASQPLNDKKEGKYDHNMKSKRFSITKKSPEIETNSPKRFAIKPEDLIRHKLNLNKVTTPRKSPTIQAKIIAMTEQNISANVVEKIAKNNSQVIIKRPSSNDLVNYHYKDKDENKPIESINENEVIPSPKVNFRKESLRSPSLTRKSSPDHSRITDTLNSHKHSLKCLIHNVYEDIDMRPQKITPQKLIQMRKKLHHIESTPRVNVIYSSPRKENEFLKRKAREKLLDPPKIAKKKQSVQILQNQSLDNINVNVINANDKSASKVYPTKFSLSPQRFSKLQNSPTAFFSKLSPITRSKSVETPKNLSLLQNIYDRDNISIKSDETIIRIEINESIDVEENDRTNQTTMTSPRIQFLKDMLEKSVDKIKSLSPLKKKSNYSPDPNVKRKLTTTRNFPNRKFTKHQNIHWESVSRESYVTKFKNSLLDSTKPKLTNFDIKLFKYTNPQQQQRQQHQQQQKTSFIRNLDEIIDSRKGEFV